MKLDRQKEKYWDYFEKSTLYAARICEYRDRHDKLIKASIKYLKTLEEMFEKTGETPLLSTGDDFNTTTLKDRARFFEIILSVKNPEFTHFLEVLGKDAENKVLADRGYTQLLPILSGLSENAKFEVSYYLLAANLDAVAKADYVEAIAKQSTFQFKNWLLSSLVAHTNEDKQPQKLFKDLLLRNVFEKQMVEKFVNDKIVGQICKDVIKLSGKTEEVEQGQIEPNEEPQLPKATKKDKTK